MAWLSGWDLRQKITIDSNGVGLSGDLTDIPISIHIPSSNTSFWNYVKSDGTDVRFTSSDGSTLLKFEIESFDNTGDDAWYHVKIPTLTSATDTIIYLYYGNASASSGEDINNTWESNFSAVYHLNQDKSAGAFDDSTTNAIDGTNNGTTDGLGRIDRARTFVAASNQYVTLANDAVLSPGTSKHAVEAIFKTSSVTTQYCYDDRSTGVAVTGLSAVSLAVAATSGRLYCVYVDIDGTTLTMCPATNYADGTLHHVVMVLNGTTAYLYVDGVQVATDTNAAFGTCTTSDGPAPAIGCYTTTPSIYSWDGIIDEVTVSKGSVARTLDWVKSRYQSGLGTWLTFGTGELAPVITCEPGSYTLTGQSVSVLHGRVVDIGAESYTLTGQSVSTLYGRTISLEAGAVNLTGTDATFPRSHVISPEGGVYTLTGQEVILLYSPTGVYAIACSAGSYALTGQGVGVLYGKVLPVEAGSFILTGQSVSILRGYQVSGDAGAINLTGTGVGLLKVFQLAANAGSYILTGSGVTFQITGEPNKVIKGVSNFPQSATVEYMIVDVILGTMQTWTNTGVVEVAGPTKSNYYILTSAIGAGGGTQGTVYWRTSDLEYEASENYEYVPMRGTDNALLAASYTAPDNAGIAALPTLSEIEASTVLAKQAKLDFVEKWILNKFVESTDGATVTLYDDDGTTPLKTWAYSPSTKTRSKAT